MKIGLLTAELHHHHGWADYSLSLVKALQKQGVDLTIVAARNNTSSAFPSHNLLPTIAPPDTFTLPQMLWQLPRIKQILSDCDVIHTTVEIYAPLAQGLVAKRPYFMTAHGSYINLPKIRRFPINKLYTNAFNNAHIICVSHYTKKIARQIVPQAKTSVVNNAVDADSLSTITAIEHEHPTILTVGGVKARKGTLELVQAVAKVREQIPLVQCVVIGSTNSEIAYVEKVRAEIERLQLEDTVHLLGFVEDAVLRDWYAKADVFALPSINHAWKFEGFGLATMEASAAGLPVIGSRNCGAEDVIDDGVTGLLISQDNIAEGLPEALLDLLTQPEKAQQMGTAGQQKALFHTWDDVAKQVIKLYEAELKNR